MERVDIARLQRRTRQGLATATAHLTATEGPLRVALDELGQRGVGARVIKGALAASIAWAVAGQVTPVSLPFLASLTALFTVQATIKQSVEGGKARLAGVVVGIAVAFAASELVGLHTWSIGLVVLAALLVGQRLRLAAGGTEQVAATAILVMFVQSASDERLVYAASHLGDTAIGTGVGLLLNALVSPPNYVPAAEAAVLALGRRLVDVLDELAAALAEGTTAAGAADLLAAAEVVQRELRSVDEALGRAEDGLTYNVVGGRQLPALARCRQVAEELRGVVTRTLGLAGVLCAAAATGPGGDLDLGSAAYPAAEAVSAVGAVVLDRVERVGAGDVGMGDDAAARAVSVRGDALRQVVAEDFDGLGVEAAMRVLPVLAGVLALGEASPVGVLVGGPARRASSRGGRRSGRSTA